MKKLTTKHLLIAFTSIAVIIPIIINAIGLNPDMDAWWLMATGRYLWEHQSIPTYNPFIIHENHVIIIQQWVIAISNYLLYTHFGNTGLIICSLALYGITLLLLYRVSKHYTDNRTIQWCCVIIGSVFFSSYINTRPTQATRIILLLEQIALLNFKKTKKLVWLWQLPLLSLLLINTHASFWPMLFVMALPHTVPNFLNKEQMKMLRKTSLKTSLPFIISIAMGFLNPYGHEGLLYIFKSYNNSELFQYISEIQPPVTASMQGIVIILAAVLLSTYIYIHIPNKCKDMDISKIHMLIGTLILAAMHTRNIWLLAFGVIPVICEIAQITLHSIHNMTKRPQFLSEKDLVLLITMPTFALCIETASIAYITRNQTLQEYLPISAAEYMGENTTSENVRLYTTFNTGGYMEWLGFQVYFDARPELFQKKINKVENIADEYYNIVIGNAEYESFIEKYDFTHILTDKNSYLDFYLRTHSDYTEVDSDTNYVLYELTSYEPGIHTLSVM